MGFFSKKGHERTFSVSLDTSNFPSLNRFRSSSSMSSAKSSTPIKPGISTSIRNKRSQSTLASLSTSISSTATLVTAPPSTTRTTTTKTFQFPPSNPLKRDQPSPSTPTRSKRSSVAPREKPVWQSSGSSIGSSETRAARSEIVIPKRHLSLAASPFDTAAKSVATTATAGPTAASPPVIPRRSASRGFKRTSVIHSDERLVRSKDEMTRPTTICEGSRFSIYVHNDDDSDGAFFYMEGVETGRSPVVSRPPFSLPTITSPALSESSVSDMSDQNVYPVPAASHSAKSSGNSFEFDDFGSPSFNSSLPLFRPPSLNSTQSPSKHAFTEIVHDPIPDPLPKQEETSWRKGCVMVVGDELKRDSLNIFADDDEDDGQIEYDMGFFSRREKWL